MMIAGITAAAGLLFLILKLGPKRVISYDIPIDIAITSFLMYILAGTYSGMMAALIGGLIVSVVLFAMKKTMIREELRLNSKTIKIARFIPLPIWYFEWVEIDPKA